MARRIGRDSSYVSRMLYPPDKKGVKRIGDDLVEAIEAAFQLPRGTLDGIAQAPGDPIDGAIAILMRGVPVVGTAQFGDEGYWEETQHPVGHGDGLIEFPSRDPNAYALRGSGSSMEPRFRHGEYVIIEPNTEVHPGDEVMVRLVSGRTMAKIFAYKREGMVHLDSINKDHAQIAVPWEQVEKMHFIAGVAKRNLWRPPSS